jgi:hypothetical protein
MPPAVVFVEEDSQIQTYHHPAYEEEDWPGGENWEDDLIEPGRLVNVGQGVTQFVPFDMPHPGILYPKRRRRKKKKKGTSTPPPPPPPEPSQSPAPIDWEDWEELCQAAPPQPPPPPPQILPWEPEEDWEAEIAAYHQEPQISPWEPEEDWEAEIAAYYAAYHQREDWDAEIAVSQ